jgi:Family of unknown function (DUF5677)
MTRKKNHKRRSRHTPLSQHRKHGSILSPPLANIPIKPSMWDRDLLPEFLWIASLRELTSLDHLYQPFYLLMDAVDEYWEEPDPPAIGMLSDLGRLAPHKVAFLEKHGDLVKEMFEDPFGEILALYPECPAAWLISPDVLSKSSDPVDDSQLSLLRRLVCDLLDPRGELATAVRLAALGRILKSGRFHFPMDSPVASLLPRYPGECTADERAVVESLGRAAMGAWLSATAEQRSNDWAMYFWRHNYRLAQCRPRLLPVVGSRPARPDDLNRLQNLVANNATAARTYIDRLAQRIAYDLYEPEREEVLHGLFARCVRLYLILCDNPTLWARDIAGILLRCLVETAITFCYLASKGTDDDFREHGEAQKKLLMLHLQDSHPEAISLEGRSAGDISNELGGFPAELLQIELGHWSTHDVRKLAKDVGLEEYYRLVFTPTSADVHGTWASLKDSNLSVCGEVLHRFHRLPSYAEPPLFVATLEGAQSVLRRVHAVAVEELKFPSDLVLEGLLPWVAEGGPNGGISS